MIIIIGAGIAGLSLGYALTRRGSKVTILEANEIASGASGVATSYLEPRLGDTAMRKIEWEGMKRWPEFAGQLQQATGVDVGFQSGGQLRVTLEENEVKFNKDLKARAAQGWKFETLNSTEVMRFEPELSPELVGGAYLPNVSWVTGKSVCIALAASIRNAGGIVRENCEVSEANGAKVTLNGGAKIEGDKVVFCTGLGANIIDGRPSDIPQSRAVRGVNLLLDMSSLKTPITHLIKHHRGNMCPRSDEKYGSHLIVGTTYEPDELNLVADADVIEKLYANAAPILPKLRELPLLGVTAGLRSKVGDGLLRLGRSTTVPTTYYSLSHAGAGFLRAPLISEEFADYILNGERGELTGSFTA
ncbi:MAG: FAD-dependent oxidoreductase [Rhizobiaceae bacterium]